MLPYLLSSAWESSWPQSIKCFHILVFLFFHSSWDDFSSLFYCVFPSLVTFLQFLNYTFYGIRMPTLCHLHLEDLKVFSQSLRSLSSNSLALEESTDCAANHGVCSISTEMRSSFTILKFWRTKLLVTNNNSHLACLWFEYTALHWPIQMGMENELMATVLLAWAWPASSAKVDVVWNG